MRISVKLLFTQIHPGSFRRARHWHDTDEQQTNATQNERKIGAECCVQWLIQQFTHQVDSVTGPFVYPLCRDALNWRQFSGNINNLNSYLIWEVFFALAANAKERPHSTSRFILLFTFAECGNTLRLSLSLFRFLIISHCLFRSLFCKMKKMVMKSWVNTAINQLSNCRKVFDFNGCV